MILNLQSTQSKTLYTLCKTNFYYQGQKIPSISMATKPKNLIQVILIGAHN